MTSFQRRPYVTIMVVLTMTDQLVLNPVQVFQLVLRW